MWYLCDSVCVWLICSAARLMTPGGSEHWRSNLCGYSELTQCEWTQSLRCIQNPWLLSHLCISLSAAGTLSPAGREGGECSLHTRAHIESGKGHWLFSCMLSSSDWKSHSERPKMAFRKSKAYICTFGDKSQTYKVWALRNICKSHKKKNL